MQTCPDSSMAFYMHSLHPDWGQSGYRDVKSSMPGFSLPCAQHESNEAQVSAAQRPVQVQQVQEACSWCVRGGLC